MSLRNTQAELPDLANGYVGYGIVLGDGVMNDDLIDELMTLQPQFLALNGKQFTGKCFANPMIRTAYLDLSGSGITAENLGYLRTGRILEVDLSNTTLDDEAIPSLAWLSIPYIDIRGTRLTANGLLSHHWPMPPTLIVGSQQFSEAELKRLKSKLRVVVDRPRLINRLMK